ncbi:ubiquitin-protein transferase [Aureococcus anophagefferens]|uniref:Ubiquitin-protein transferase n=1 Tax=Aureococcus anophagefferens TaxID=44056 RepID=A0ABR1FWX7_AURAN
MRIADSEMFARERECAAEQKKKLLKRLEEAHPRVGTVGSPELECQYNAALGTIAAWQMQAAKIERERDAADARATAWEQQLLEARADSITLVEHVSDATEALEAANAAFEAMRAESRRFACDDLDGLDLAGLAALATSLDAARARVQAAREARLNSVPETFMCPITCEPMLDPVVLADGHSYERAAIARWLETHDTSPQTNLSLAHKHLTPNITLRNAIRDAGIG